jgi:hypothetical protein
MKFLNFLRNLFSSKPEVVKSVNKQSFVFQEVVMAEEPVEVISPIESIVKVDNDKIEKESKPKKKKVEKTTETTKEIKAKSTKPSENKVKKSPAKKPADKNSTSIKKTKKSE